MKRLLKEVVLFLSASLCAGVLAIFVVWGFLVNFPFDWLRTDPEYHEQVPPEIRTLSSSTLSAAETKTYYGNDGRVDFSKK